MKNIVIWNVTVIMLLLLTIACAGSCKKETGEGPGGDPDRQEKGYALGNAVDGNGHPLAGVKVTISNTMVYDSYATGNTDANGNYRIQLPVVGTFHASAQVTRILEGVEYNLDLHPDTDEPFGINGGIVNFVWKLNGERIHQEDGFYGATVIMNNAPGCFIYDSEHITFTLVPQGNLIDGSRGQTLVLKPGNPGTPTMDQLVDIPLGVYSMTAEYEHDGIRIPLKLSTNGEFVYTSPYRVKFMPFATYGRNAIAIWYSDN